jgi:hypothetical protein
MSNPVQQNDVQIDRIHSGAVCEEIGERLCQALDRQSSALSPRLLALIEQLAKVERRKDPTKIRRNLNP